MTANAGYHAYATGDVLTAAQVQYNLQNQTVMYFASSAARTTALTGVLVEGMVSYIPANGLEYYNGSAWVVVAADQTPLTTKGDLFTYSTTDTRLPVGANGTSLVADSSQTTGLGWSATPSASNPVLNSAMQVWQRGTSVSAVASLSQQYTADRWALNTAASQASTVSRQVTGDTTNLPSIQYCARVQRNSGQTGTGAMSFDQSLETINSIPFVGKGVTVSFYARAGANYSATGSGFTLQLLSGTGTDQNANTATGLAVIASTSVTLTTTWQRFTFTASVGTTVTQLFTRFANTPTGTAGTNDYYEVTGVQIDVGSVALPFRTYAATIQGELAACQRYYYRMGGAQAYTYLGYGSAQNSTLAYPLVYPPSTMRVTPTQIDYSTLALYDGGTITAVTSVSVGGANGPVTINSNTASGLTAQRAYFLITNNSTSAYLGLSAEL